MDKRGRGRPPLPAGQAREVNLTIRCRASLKTALQLAAQASGRSLSAEVDYRLAAGLPQEFRLRRIAELEAELSALRSGDGKA